MSDNTPPQVLDLFKDFFEIYKRDFMAFTLGGAGLVAITLPMSLFAVGGLYAVMFLGMVPGMAMEDEGILLLGMLASTVLGTAAMVAVMVAVITPLQASFTRSVDAHLAGGEPLSIGSAFTRATEDLPRVLVFAVLQACIGMALLMLCYLPGIVFMALTDFAWCHVILGRKSPMEAIQASVSHAMENGAWHFGYVCVTFGIALIASYLPIVGMFIAPGLVTGWRVYTYRRVIEPRAA